MTTTKARVALVGAGWWSQGWHLPHLDKNEKVEIAAIVDVSPYPKSNLNPNLEPLSKLADKYHAPIYSSVEELLSSPDSTQDETALDGILVATPHATHSQVGAQLLEHAKQRHHQGRKPLHTLMEKPMTTDVEEAYKLYRIVQDYRSIGGKGCFLVNHSANYRLQSQKAREAVMESTNNIIGPIRHVSAFFASPLTWIFNDPTNTGWNEPGHNMLGNGFCWGQQSHLLGWIFHVCPNLVPIKAFCAMNHSYTTSADVSHAATILCKDTTTNSNKRNGEENQDDTVVMSISGTTLLPGNAHSEPPVPKQVSIQIFGSKGAILYSGNDRDTDSGRLELRQESGAVQVMVDRFDFENLDSNGTGPESLESFLEACSGSQSYYEGADALLGLRTVQTIDAMYRSHQSKQMEDIKYSDAHQ